MQDTELIAMQKIKRILDELEDKAKGRVISWLNDKLQP